MTRDAVRLEQELQLTPGGPAPRSLHPALVVLTAWLLLLVSGLAAIGLSVALALRLARRGRRRAAAIALALSPTVLAPLAVVSAIRNHATGSATIYRASRPESTFDRLDPALRCPQVRADGGLFGAWGVPNNLALRALGALRGPVSGSYDGPLPDAHEAAALLATTEHRVGLGDVEGGRLTLGARTVQVPTHAVRDLLLAARGRYFDDPTQAELDAALLEERALLLAVAYDPAPGEREGPFMTLIDLETGRVVTQGCERLPR